MSAKGAIQAAKSLNSLDSDRFMGCPLPCGHTVGDFAFPGLDWPELDEIAEYLKGRR